MNAIDKIPTLEICIVRTKVIQFLVNDQYIKDSRTVVHIIILTRHSRLNKYKMYLPKNVQMDIFLKRPKTEVYLIKSKN